ncbi:helix-turn-helix domain-containing protein [Paenibacillus segetis]|uniref:Two-component system, response regulator YesN n=1 Tax=Paenibacillus segetis TaxID=1325360 RepID=A0ABQ1YTZ1_9BACL|nr:helix-turn-helix domain-containing protein [Paenibacillus segetis]GGH38422.1 hypothetical protein GCM10008013_46490 [Paenibacillus segetis]
MYNVMLADDEVLDLRGLERFIPWEGLQMKVAAVVNSGVAALEYMKLNTIHILITDIRMPIMSGLELSREALQLYPHLKIIFISGYEDFQYAQQAMQLNAQSYVLKPIDDEEIIQALHKVKAQLDLESQQSLLENAYHKTLPVVKNDLLVQLYEGQLDWNANAAMLTEQYGIKLSQSEFSVAYIEIDDLAWKLDTYEGHEAKAIVNRVYSVIDQHCKQHGIHSLCKLSAHQFAMMIESNQQHIELLHDLITEIAATLPITITIGLGSVFSTFQQAQISYQQAQQALDFKMLVGKSIVIRYDDIEINHVKEVQHWEMALDALFVEMSNYRLVQIHDDFEHLFSLIRNMKSKVTVYNFSIQIISKLNAYLATLNEDLFQMPGMQLEDLHMIFKFETIDDIKTWLRRRVFEISELLHLKKQKKNNRLIESICTYVEEHLHENIVLRDVSNYFSFSPNHLGQIFKQATGINFSDYVVDRRMERARKLLQDHQGKVFEIAGQVGYKNQTYFNRQFKEHFGMTPGEYRKQS